MKRGVGAVIAGVLAGCVAIAGPLVEALRPEIALSMEADGVVRIQSWVTPVGPAGYRDRPAELEWTLVPQVGPWRIVAAFGEVLSLDAGEERTFVDWRIRLPAGAYTLSWGNACEGWVSATFVIREDEIGERVLMAPARFLSPRTPHAVAGADEPAWTADPEARRAVAWARASLAEDLAICTRKIEVAEALTRDFSDTSLGVREPGVLYAQVVTPGYIVRLRAGERAFEYRVAGGLLVRVPDLPQGPIPDDVWAVRVYAYHVGVDLLLHGDVTCSPEAVLPLARWVPGDADPARGALNLLLGQRLAPWEVAEGFASEFPLPGVRVAALFLSNGTLTVLLGDPEHRTSGGACRTGILRAQIEKTALQFPDVKEVRILPPECLQP